MWTYFDKTQVDIECIAAYALKQVHVCVRKTHK